MGAAVRGRRNARMDVVNSHAPRRSPGSKWVAVVLVTALAVLAAGCASPVSIDPPEPVAVTVEHGDETSVASVLPGTSVGAVLAQVGLTGVDGQVLSAAKKEPIGPNGDLATIQMGGRSVDAATLVRAASTIEVIDGTDTVEDTERLERPMDPAPLPDALQHVYAPGEPGLEEVVVGVESGEVVSRTTLIPAVDPHQATGKVMALTFDDGPDPTWTPQVLDILKAKGVTATFCTVGTMVEAHPELLQRIVDEGHLLCNHTQNHQVGLDSEPAEIIAAEFDGGAGAIEDAVGTRAPYYRPPGGSLGPAIYEAAAERDEQVLYWSIDPTDWKRPEPLVIALTVISQFEPGGIILLHDGGGNREHTVTALPLIIDFATAQGYTFTAPISRRSQVG